VEDLEDRWLPTSPVITWPAPGDMTYGTLLGAAQLDAMADVPGSFIYNPPAGTRLQPGQSQTLTATFLPNDTATYSSAVATVQINVNPAPLTVTGITASDKVYDGSYAAATNTEAAMLAGVFSGDSVTLSTVASTSYPGLHGPSGVAIDPAGNVYVANRDLDTVSKFTPGSTTPSAILTGLYEPGPLACDSRGNLYVINEGNGTVSKFTAGSLTPSANLTALDSPGLLTIDPFDNVYVSNQSSWTVNKFPPGSTAPSSTLTLFHDALAMVCDGSGNLYEANSGVNGNTEINKFAPGSNSPTSTFTVRNDISGLAVDTAGNLYASNILSGTVSKFTPGSSTPSAVLVGLDYPIALASDGQGNLYVASRESTTISKFSPGATIPSAVMTGSGTLTFDLNGNLFVNDGKTVRRYSASALAQPASIPPAMEGEFLSKDVGKNSVMVPGLMLTGAEAGDYYCAGGATANITPAPLTVTGITAADKIYDGTTTATVDTTGVGLTGVVSGDEVAFETNSDTALTGLNDPLTVATDSDGNVYVLNSGQNTVSKFAPGSTIPTATLTGLGTAYALAVDPSGNIYIANYDSNTVAKFAPGATTASAILTGLDRPVALACDPAGNLYVANWSTVSKFAPGSTAPNATLTGVSRASALACDAAGNLYVASSISDTVAKFAPGGTTPSATFTGVGTPLALAADTAGNLYVGNSGSTVIKFASGSTTPTAILRVFREQQQAYAIDPIALAIDKSGTVYVASRFFEPNEYKDLLTVSAFSPGSTIPTAILVGVKNPVGLALDPQGNLYVINSTSNTLTKFTASALHSPVGVASFVSKNVGSNFAVTAAPVVLGSQAGDYVVLPETLAASIAPAPLTIAASPNTKPYDGTSSAAAVPTVAGLVQSDTVTGLAEVYTDPSPGTGKTLVVTGYSVSDGNGGKNYTVSTVLNSTGVITSLLPAAGFQVSAAAVTNLGVPDSFMVTATDKNGDPTSAYSGVVHFSSTDSSASLPADAALTKGTGVFAVTFSAAGTQTISVSDTLAPGITGSSGIITVNPLATQLAVTAPADVGAGSRFLVTVTAQDSNGRTATGYNGTIQVTAGSGPPFAPADATLVAGVGHVLVTLTTAGTFTIKVQDTGNPALVGVSGNVVVGPAAVAYFSVQLPNTAITGNPVSAVVTALDPFGNIAYAYAGKVHFTSSDAGAVLPPDSSLTGGVGTFNVTLNTAGSQTITATDNLFGLPTITGTSSRISTRGLTVTSLTPTATGFTVTFSKTFTSADVNLYGGSQPGLLQDVTLVGTRSGMVNGSFVVDPSGTSATFKASSIFLSTFFQSSVLPDDTWTVTLASGTGTGATTHGFFDALNAPLDGSNNAGHDNYTTSFATANANKETLSIPDFARGPDGANIIKVPNDSADGIPVTLSNVPAASGVTDVVFTLTYNPNLLVPTGGGTGDSSGAGSMFVMGAPVSLDATHSTVTFTWHNGAAQSGAVVLGDILANVPNSAANAYKGEEIVGLSGIKVNKADFTGVWANGLHVNAYFGDVTGDGKITGLDVATAGIVARGNSLGLGSYKLVDPAVVGDIAGDGSIDATAVSDLASYTSSLPTPPIPAIPTGLTITPGGPDPTLSLASGNGIVSVLLDHPHPVGSTGMEEAVLALTYDPKVLTLSASDITLGSISGLNSGWHLVSVVDQATGQIGIDLYSTTAISATQAGSLVNISFHVVPGAAVPATGVALVNSVTPYGLSFSTEVADDQGQYILSPGMDRLMVETGSSSVSSLAPWANKGTRRQFDPRQTGVRNRLL
jgi:hypothetical protein